MKCSITGPRCRSARQLCRDLCGLLDDTYRIIHVLCQRYLSIILWILCVASMAALLGPLCWAQNVQKVDATRYCRYKPSAWNSSAGAEMLAELDPAVRFGAAGTVQGTTTTDIPGFSNDSKALLDDLQNNIPNDIRTYGAGNEIAMVEIQCRFMTVDFSLRKAVLLCLVGFWGSLSKPPTYSGLHLPQGQNLVVEYGSYNTVDMADGAHPTAQELLLPLGSSLHPERDTLNYPYTSLSWELLVSAYTRNSSNGSWISSVPLTIAMSAYQLPLFKVDFGCTVANETHLADKFAQLRLSGTVALAPFSLHLLIGMQGAMWAMAGLAFATTVWWAFREQEPRYDLLAFQATMLFALPAMRQLWPAAPPGGTDADVMHIYAQLLLISFGICIMLLKMLFTLICAIHAPPAPPPPAQAVVIGNP